MTYKVYNIKEKEIIYNYLVIKEPLHINNFSLYLQEYVKNHGRYKSEVAHMSYNSMLSALPEIYDYNTNNILWDKITGDNLITFFLQEKNFLPKNFSNLDKLKPDWNHINHEGNNALHYLAMRNNDIAIKEILEKHNIEKNLKNNNGDYYTFLFLKPYDIELINPEPIAQCFLDNPEHFANSTLDKLEEIKDNLEVIKKLRIDNYKNYKPEIELNVIERTVREKFAVLDNAFQYYYLEKKTSEGDNKYKKKYKI